MSVADAMILLERARAKYSEVNAEVVAWRSAETKALNALNEAQRDFDSAVAAVRSDPPWNSDWHSRNKQGEAT